jgi:putative zinc finger protein
VAADEPEDLNCRNASRLLSLACERPLTAGELRALKYHLDECFRCANFEQQLNFLHKASQVFRTGS